MEKVRVTYIDRGIDERLLINDVDEGRIDKLSARHLLELLKRHGALDHLEVISFDDYENRGDDVI